MKKITLFAALFAAVSASAQITYTSADFAAAEEQFTVTKASGFLGMNFALTGANYNWDYSGLDVDSQTTNAPWADPEDSGYKFAWCLTNGYLFNCNSQWDNNFTHSLLMTDGFELEQFGVSNIVEHSRANAAGFEHRMRGISATISGITIPMAVEYTAPDVVYHFPMVYNDSYTTNGSFSLDLNNFGLPFQYGLTTERNVTVEGWGQLTTPHGTYDSVLKVKTVLEKTETINIQGIEIPITTTTILYQWFDKDFGIPVLHAEGMQIFGFFVPTAVNYLDGEQCLPPLATFANTSANYNADTQSASVSFSNSSINYDAVEWNFGNGETSTDNSPSHVFNCPGSHEVTLTIMNNACIPAQSSVITQTVVVTDTENVLTSEVTLAENTLTATRNVSGTTYQWIDCDNANAPVDGAIAQSFTPVISGNYACMMSTNGCDATSECMLVSVLGTSQFNTNGQVQLYPNPTTGKLHLSGNTGNVSKVEIYNVLGMLVANGLDLTNQASGVYIVRITTDQGVITRKVVKE